MRSTQIDKELRLPQNGKNIYNRIPLPTSDQLARKQNDFLFINIFALFFLYFHVIDLNMTATASGQFMHKFCKCFL